MLTCAFLSYVQAVSGVPNAGQVRCGTSLKDDRPPNAWWRFRV